MGMIGLNVTKAEPISGGALSIDSLSVGSVQVRMLLRRNVIGRYCRMIDDSLSLCIASC